MTFTLQLTSPAKGGTATTIVVGEVDMTGIILVLEQTSQALTFDASVGRPFPVTVYSIPLKDPPLIDPEP